jgi:hypothetical protein
MSKASRVTTAFLRFGYLKLPGAWNLGFGALRESLERWRVHHQHRDHTPEKYEQHNSQANKDCLGKLVALLSQEAEWRSIGEVHRRFACFYICSV